MPQETAQKRKIGRPFEKGNRAGVGHGRPPGERSIKQAIRRSVQKMLTEEGGLEDFMARFVKDARKEGTYAYRRLTDMILSDGILSEIEEQLERRRLEDMDFLAYRIWGGAFDMQQQVLLSKQRRVYMMAGRRAGKTNVIARLMAQTVVRCQHEGGARCLYVGKTITTAVEQLWTELTGLLKGLGFRISEQRRNEGYIKLEGGHELYLRGNSTTEEREKLRGFKWDIAIIDEGQSQTALKYLIEDVIEPALVDRRGRLIVSGTGPRVRGTYWEEVLWLGRHEALRLNWNLSQNPTIPECETALEAVLADKGLSRLDPMFVREYLGQIAYDDDALVLRLGEANWYTDAQLRAWIDAIPVTDVRFVAGLDYGFVDADGFTIVAYAEGRPERWVVYEYKKARTGVAELAQAIRDGVAYIEKDPLFARLVNKQFYIHADTGGAGQKIGFDLATQYNLPIQDAYKVNKDLAIELLQDEARRGTLKVRKGGALEAEALRTVFRRDDLDRLTREVDDEAYHPDLMDALTYAMRTIWWFGRKVNE